MTKYQKAMQIVDRRAKHRYEVTMADYTLDDPLIAADNPGCILPSRSVVLSHYKDEWTAEELAHNRKCPSCADFWRVCQDGRKLYDTQQAVYAEMRKDEPDEAEIVRLTRLAQAESVRFRNAQISAQASSMGVTLPSLDLSAILGLGAPPAEEAQPAPPARSRHPRRDLN